MVTQPVPLGAVPTASLLMPIDGFAFTTNVGRGERFSTYLTITETVCVPALIAQRNRHKPT
jgi:hypothetical protein